MTSKCKCGRFVSSTEGAKCKKCSSLFHRDCVNLSPNNPVPSKWMCETCQKGKSKGTNSKTSSTPASKVPHTSIPPLFPASLEPTPVDSIQADPANCIVAELRLLRNEMTSFREEIARLNTTLFEFTSRMDNIETRVSRLEDQTASRESSENGSLQAAFSLLQSQLNDRDQELLMNDIEISGLHEVPGENLLSTTNLLAKKLGVELDDRDVVSAVRSGPLRRASSVGAGVGERAVIVRLARRAVRDDLLRCARVRRGADSSGINDAEPRRFYVNEHLTRNNRQLFNKVREQGRNKNWRFTWTKGGRIYIRQTVTSPVHRVRSEADVERYFANDCF